MSATLPTILRNRALAGEPLAKYTAARLGGAADWLYVARESPHDLQAVVAAAWSADLPVRVLGGGANVLIADSGVRGLVVINKTDSVTWLPPDNRVRVASGVNLKKLAHQCQARGLSGFEWAVSVPGTIGGAVINNAGAHGGDMAANVVSVDLLDAEAGLHTLSIDDLGYDYRHSQLKARADRRFLVVSAVLQFTPDDPETIRGRMDGFIAQRKRTQPPGASLGSIFKNPPGDYAGRLIDAAGLKGHQIGGAQVSALHANFFINTGGATAADYYALIGSVQAEVARQTGVTLELEIEIVGEFTNSESPTTD